MKAFLQVMKQWWEESDLLKLLYVIVMLALIGLAVRACVWAWS